MNANDNWWRIDDIANLDSPALVIFPERVKANIQTAISIVGEVSRLRPHVKTNKSAEATRLMMQAGISKFKCATIAEAEMLGMLEAKDVLLAYQPVGPKIRRFVELIKKYPATDYSCLTDNTTAATEQANAFAKNNLTVPVYVDLNVGMNRTGISPGETAVNLYKHLSSLKGIKAAGLHVYDGHLRNPDIVQRKKECDETFRKIEELKERLISLGLEILSIIAGGSPTFPIHAQRKDVECSPGTFIYWDRGYGELCPEQPFLPAAVLVTRIISIPAKGRICLDLGHKSVAAENEITRRVYFLNAKDVKPIAQSEEHLVLEVPENNLYQPGDVFYGIPYHVCPTVALYEKAYAVEDRKINGEWKTVARDRKILT
jgi:D-serine deaminase-like pyridoxal phosphate-dependent protein